MARGDQLGRQWQIIQLLMASSRGKTVRALSRHLNYHRRTIYRDLDALQVAGFPLYTTQSGNRRYWKLLETTDNQISIPLTQTELMALYFSQGMAQSLKDTPFYDSLKSMFRKIETILPPHYRRYLRQADQSLHVATLPVKTKGQWGEMLTLINSAILERHYIDIKYSGYP